MPRPRATTRTRLLHPGPWRQRRLAHVNSTSPHLSPHQSINHMLVGLRRSRREVESESQDTDRRTPAIYKASAGDIDHRQQQHRDVDSFLGSDAGAGPWEMAVIGPSTAWRALTCICIRARSTNALAPRPLADKRCAGQSDRLELEMRLSPAAGPRITVDVLRLSSSPTNPGTLAIAVLADTLVGLAALDFCL